MASSRPESRRSEHVDLALGLALAAALMGVLWSLCAPRWETNDDVAMSMIVHGYGIAAPGAAPQLMFSNLLWGYLARSIPTVGGLLGYSIATIAVIFLACAGLLYGLRRLGIDAWTSLAAAALVFARPILFPQFTLNAGLLAIAALALWLAFAVDGRRWLLAAAVLLAFASFLIRSQEFMLVLAVALPLLSWRMLRPGAARLAIVVVMCAIGAAVWIDEASYRVEAWQPFNALNPARARLTDFHAGDSLREHPEIAARHGYSLNDVELVEQWFFVDPKIADPARLKALLADASERPAHDRFHVDASMQALGHGALRMLVLVAVLGTVLWPSRRMLLAWAVFLAAIVAIGFFGRPGIIRVYLPAVGLLALAPMLRGVRLQGVRGRVFSTALALATVANAVQVLDESRATRTADAAARSQIAGFPTDPVVIWGVGFPFEAVYRVFGASQEAMHYQLYGLGVSTLAPFSVASAEERRGRGMVARLLSTEGVPLLATDKSLRLLGDYCREHHRSELQRVDREVQLGSQPPHYRCAVQ
ncbi:hypothetical protein [Variovorax sp. PBL-E5]|uniref:hypothetical protein n=1 Tax=Variovorax sp. PBL-E5 TaxID=434014 RepID=UPI0013A539FA|nr:hypothetical protein [Variovorax sp. PBL-E5]